MAQLLAVEIIYRGVFQKTLAKNITRGIVLAAHNEGKLGISFGRYGDAPERNGIPGKSFAIVASDEQTLEAGDRLPLGGHRQAPARQLQHLRAVGGG